MTVRVQGKQPESIDGLRTTTLAPLRPANSRRFVGDEPSLDVSAGELFAAGAEVPRGRRLPQVSNPPPSKEPAVLDDPRERRLRSQRAVSRRPEG